MRLQSILDMVGGELKSSSSVTYFNEIKFVPKSVKRGDLYILYQDDIDKLDEVIRNGAYGVVFDCDLKIDSKLDIAFIKVNSSRLTSFRLLRFLLLSCSHRFFLLNSLNFDFAKRIITDKSVIFLADSKERNNFQKIISADSNSIFFTKDKEILEAISPLYNTLKYDFVEKFSLVDTTLFESSFIYDMELYHRAKIPKIFLDNLLELVSFLKCEGVSFSLKQLSFTEHFEPIYVDKFLSIKDFSKSDKVLICESCPTLIESEFNYLFESTKWAKSLFAISKYRDIYFDGIKVDIVFKDENDLIDKLLERTFNFVLVFGIDSRQLKERLNQKRITIENKTLF